MPVQEHLNVRETARRLGVHENTVRNWERRGLIRARRLPGSGFRRFDATEIDRLHREMTTHLAPVEEGPIVVRSLAGTISWDDE